MQLSSSTDQGDGTGAWAWLDHSPPGSWIKSQFGPVDGVVAGTGHQVAKQKIADLRQLIERDNSCSPFKDERAIWRPNCSHAMRRDALQPISPSCSGLLLN